MPTPKGRHPLHSDFFYGNRFFGADRNTRLAAKALVRLGNFRYFVLYREDVCGTNVHTFATLLALAFIDLRDVHEQTPVLQGFPSPSVTDGNGGGDFFCGRDYTPVGLQVNNGSAIVRGCRNNDRPLTTRRIGCYPSQKPNSSVPIGCRCEVAEDRALTPRQLHATACCHHGRDAITVTFVTDVSGPCYRTQRVPNENR